MDDTDLQMQVERSSQAGSVSGMEVEGDDGALTLPDADMEIHELDAAGAAAAADTLALALAQDEDMAAEMHEQEQLHAIAEWKDPVLGNGVPSHTVELDHMSQTEPVTAHPGASAVEELDVLPEDDPHVYPAAEPEAGQLTLEETGHAIGSAAGRVKGADGGSDAVAEGAPGAAAPTGVAEGARNDAEAQESHGQVSKRASREVVHTEHGGGDASADADQATDAYPETNGHSKDDFEDVPSTLRPKLQKSYLDHVNVSPSDVDSDSTTWAPHVCLIYDNLSYSLFRPSSSPSGDDEQVLFGDADTEHPLYYASLGVLFDRFHAAFPDLRGDGDNEMILDFGILDMQISEDNVYAKQLSLHDFDRIRVGMCQPELDRLQVNVIVGKRFVYRFNELAEHCYRMYAGSADDDDAGTITGEEVGEDNVDYVEGADVETNDNAETDYVEQEYEDPDEESIPAAHGQNIEGADDAGAEEHIDASGGEQDADEGVDDVHPPSDEHYEDGEFATLDGEGVGENDDGAPDDTGEVEDEVEAAANGSEDRDEDRDDGSATVQGDPAEVDVEGVDLEEYEEPVDYSAPLGEAVEQAEAYDEAVADAEEGLEEEAEAAAHIDGDSAFPTHESADRPKDHAPDEEEAEYYHRLGSPTDEEVVFVERPATGGEVETVLANVLDDSGHIEENTDTDPARILAPKRSRDVEVFDDGSSGGGESTAGLESATKKPKIAS